MRNLVGRLGTNYFDCAVMFYEGLCGKADFFEIFEIAFFEHDKWAAKNSALRNAVSFLKRHFEPIGGIVVGDWDATYFDVVVSVIAPDNGAAAEFVRVHHDDGIGNVVNLVQLLRSIRFAADAAGVGDADPEAIGQRADDLFLGRRAGHLFSPLKYNH